MKVLTDFLSEVVSGKIVLSLGCAGYSKDYSLTRTTRLLCKLSKKWYGCDNNRDFLKAHKEKDNLFYCDLNNTDYFSKVPKDVELILVVEVLEHLHNPYLALKYICENKNKNTEVLISVPNGTSLGRILYGVLHKEKLSAQDIYHYCLFNEQTLSNLCQDAGLKDYKIYPYVNSKIYYWLLRFFPNLASGFLVFGK